MARVVTDRFHCNVLFVTDIHQYGPVTMIVPASGHKARCIPWAQMGTFNKEIGFYVGQNYLHCIYFWGMPTIGSTFDVANMVRTATVKDVPIYNDAHLNIHNDALPNIHKLWWLCLVPTSTTMFASNAGYRMAKIWHGYTRIFLWTMTSNSLTETEEHDTPSQIPKTIFGLHAWNIFRPQNVWFPVYL